MLENNEGQLLSCQELQKEVFTNRSLVIAANRAPITFNLDEAGNLTFERGFGGLVTALLGLAQQVDATWIGCARTQADSIWQEGYVPLDEDGKSIYVRFLAPESSAYDGYYNVIANPLLWFLQHSMWDVPRAPVIDRATWQAWEDGYVEVNRKFAEAIVAQVRNTPESAIVMLQDYHLYLVGRICWRTKRPTR